MVTRWARCAPDHPFRWSRGRPAHLRDLCAL